MAIKVSAAVYEGLEAIRQSGETNMLHRTNVINLALVHGWLDAAAFVKENPDLYARGIFEGFEVEE